MVQDKNGNEIKEGDSVTIDGNPASCIVVKTRRKDSWFPIDVICIADQKSAAVKIGKFAKIKSTTNEINKTVERTYTEAEMNGAFGAGIEFENDRCCNPNMDKRHDPDLCYSKFLKSLNTPKP